MHTHAYICMHTQYVHSMCTLTHKCLSTISLGTFYVQDVNATSTMNDGMVEIRGLFIINSPAKGCFIIVKCNSSSPDRMMAVLNTSVPAVVSGLESNNYSILAYDVEENGLPNEKLAVEVNYESVSQQGQ